MPSNDADSKYILAAEAHSEGKLGKLRADLSSFSSSGDMALICGSYARREASSHSDLDYFVIRSDSATDHSLIERVRKSAARLGLKSPATGGAFDNEEDQESLLKNIGGNNDSNRDITQRVLLLLEGDWLVGKCQFFDLRRQILELYVKDELVPDHHLALFLLNDIIRYWRTVCVDYEYKVHEEGKPWAIRNIKLVFSRKLSYASGLFSVALTADLSRNRKIDKLEELFSLSVIDRLIYVCGTSAMRPVLGSYDRFLACMADDERRSTLEKLENTPENRRSDPTFREVKNEGYRFTRELLKLFEYTFHPTHQIRRAIIY